MEITLVDDINEPITIIVEKEILVKIPYFKKLMEFGIGPKINKETIHVPDSKITYDLIISFCGQNPNPYKLPQNKYKFKIIECQFFLGLDYDPELLEDIKIQNNEEFEQLLKTIELIGFDDDTLKIITRNIPENYDINNLSKELIKEMVRIESNYYILFADGQYIKILDTETYQEIKTFKIHTKWIRDISFSSDDKMIVSCDDDYNIKIWDVNSCRQIKKFNGKNNRIENISFSPDNKLIVACNEAHHTIMIWDIETGQIIKTFEGHTGWVYNTVFSPDSKMIVSCSIDTTIKLWDVDDGVEIKTFKGHKDWVYNAVFSSDNKMIVSCSADKSIKLWDVTTGREIKSFYGHTDGVCDVFFSPNDKMIVSCSADKTIKLWDVETCEIIETFNEHTDRIQKVVISSDNKMIISYSFDRTIKLWDRNKRKLIKSINIGNLTHSLSFSKKKYPNELAKKLIRYLD